MRAWFLPTVLAGVVSAGACSVVNAPDDPAAPSTSATSSSSGGQAGSGGATGGRGGSVGGSGGAAGPECGNGVEEGDEECDEGGETADCDLDCTEVSCGDGTINRTANEECDDGDTDAGDACDGQCQITPFDIDLDPSVNGGIMLLFMQPAVGLTVLNSEEHFVAVWSKEVNGFAETDVLGRLFTAGGDAVGTADTQLNTTASAVGPQIASNGAGRSVVLWPSTTDNGVHYRVLEPGDLPTAGTDQLIPSSDVAIGMPNVGAAPSGEFCMLWQQADATADYQAAYCLDATGSDSGAVMHNFGPSVFAVSTVSAAHGMQSITPIQDGFIVGWFAGSPPVYTGQRASLTGLPLGQTFALTGLDGMVHAVNGLGEAQSGAFLAGFVAAGTFGEATSERRPLIRPFASAATPSEDASLASVDHKLQYGLRLVGAPRDSFVAIWVEEDTSISGCGIRARKFDAGLVPAGPAFDVQPTEQDRCRSYAEAKVNTAGDVFVIYLDEDRRVGATVPDAIRAVVLQGILAQ